MTRQVVTRLAVTLGDPHGIGPEVMLRAAVSSDADLVFVAPCAVVDFWADACGLDAGAFTVLDTGTTPGPLRPGVVDAAAGAMALACLERACDLALSGDVDGLVTGPVDKTALRMAGFRHEGQTGWLAEHCGAPGTGMLMVGGGLRVLLLTRHLPLREALSSITPAGVLEALRLGHETLNRMGVPHARIAVAGINPHAGEGGLIGCEDGDLLAPAVAVAREEGIEAFGPVPGDSVYALMLAGECDLVLAPAHDVGLAPIKTLAFHETVTVAAGLPVLRVSVSHGTAMDIAGKGVADTGSAAAAYALAASLAPTWRHAAAL